MNYYIADGYFYSSDELYHHGILGMKWGVRRYQPYPKGKHGTFLGQSRDEDIRISKGSEAYRVQSTDKVQGTGQTYISLDKLDHVEYIKATASSEGGVALDCMMDNKNEGRAYSVRMKLSQDIIAPSYQKTMDAFVKTIDSVKTKDIAKDMGVRSGKEFVKNCKHLKCDEARDNAYVAFASTFMRDTKAKNIFFNQLKAEGYNAIIDDWDARFGNGMTKTPMIVFEKDKTVKQTGTKPLSQKDYDYFSEIFWGGGREERLYKNQVKEWDKWAGSNNYRKHY